MLWYHFCYQGASRMRGRLGSMGSIGSFEKVSVLEGWQHHYLILKIKLLWPQREQSSWKWIYAAIHESLKVIVTAVQIVERVCDEVFHW